MKKLIEKLVNKIANLYGWNAEIYWGKDWGQRGIIFFKDPRLKRR